MYHITTSTYNQHHDAINTVLFCVCSGTIKTSPFFLRFAKAASKAQDVYIYINDCKIADLVMRIDENCQVPYFAHLKQQQQQNQQINNSPSYHHHHNHSHHLHHHRQHLDISSNTNNNTNLQQQQQQFVDPQLHDAAAVAIASSSSAPSSSSQYYSSSSSSSSVTPSNSTSMPTAPLSINSSAASSSSSASSSQKDLAIQKKSWQESWLESMDQELVHKFEEMTPDYPNDTTKIQIVLEQVLQKQQQLQATNSNNNDTSSSTCCEATIKFVMASAASASSSASITATATASSHSHLHHHNHNHNHHHNQQQQQQQQQQLDHSTSLYSHIYLWNYSDKLIVSDVDGTITKSDVKGQIYSRFGYDWTHEGICSLYNRISNNNKYRVLYLTARPISQLESTRQYISNIVQRDLVIDSNNNNNNNSKQEEDKVVVVNNNNNNNNTSEEPQVNEQKQEEQESALNIHNSNNKDQSNNNNNQQVQQKQQQQQQSVAIVSAQSNDNSSNNSTTKSYVYSAWDFVKSLVTSTPSDNIQVADNNNSKVSSNSNNNNNNKPHYVNRKMPHGPIFTSYNKVINAFVREVVLRRPDIFKTQMLTMVKSLFAPYEPFHAGFGNRPTDCQAYIAAGVPDTNCFRINPKSEIRVYCNDTTFSSYLDMYKHVDKYFPPLVKADEVQQVESNEKSQQAAKEEVLCSEDLNHAELERVATETNLLKEQEDQIGEQQEQPLDLDTINNEDEEDKTEQEYQQ